MTVTAATPRTRTQGLLYGVFMTVFMTIGMEIYNNAVKMGVNLQPGGFSNMDWSVITGAIEELPLMLPIVFAISNLYGNRVGHTIASRLVDPDRDSEFWQRCVTIACTTLVMCPSMSLFASILFNVVLAGRPVVDLPVIYLGTVYKNFAMALLWNLFVASPLSQLCLGKVYVARRARVDGPCEDSEPAL